MREGRREAVLSFENDSKYIYAQGREAMLLSKNDPEYVYA